MDKLKTEIEKAEKIEQGSYSDESFAELTKAIESAKALEEKASKEPIVNLFGSESWRRAGRYSDKG